MRRSKLKSATARLFRTQAFNELTLEQITAEAEIPTSVFYHYFTSKKELTLELLDEVFDEFQSEVLEAGPFDTFGRGAVASITAMLKLYKENAGLMRCLTEPEFASRWQKHVYHWRERVARGLEEFADPNFKDMTECTGIAHVLSSMTESVAYELYVTRNPALRRLLTDIDTAAAFLSTMWSRALFMRQPDYVDAEQFAVLSHLKGNSTRPETG